MTSLAPQALVPRSQVGVQMPYYPGTTQMTPTYAPQGGGLLSPMSLLTGPVPGSSVGSLGGLFGLGGGGSSAGAAGGGLLSSGGFGSLAGGAGIGALGGGLTAKLTGGNTTGGSLGGAVGGAIGTAIAPGIGTAIGSALGGVVGGLFGGGKKKPKFVASEFAGHIGDDGSIPVDPRTARADPTVGKFVGDSTSGYFQALKQATGIDFKGEIVRGGLNNRRGGGYVAVDTRGVGFNPDTDLGGKPKTFNFDPNNPMQAHDAIGQSALFLAERNKMTPEQIKQIKDFNSQYLQGKDAQRMGISTGGGGAAQGPMIDGRQTERGQSFSDFVAQYKKQQEQGKA